MAKGDYILAVFALSDITGVVVYNVDKQTHDI